MMEVFVKKWTVIGQFKQIKHTVEPRCAMTYPKRLPMLGCRLLKLDVVNIAMKLKVARNTFTFI